MDNPMAKLPTEGFEASTKVSYRVTGCKNCDFREEKIGSIKIQTLQYQSIELKRPKNHYNLVSCGVIGCPICYNQRDIYENLLKLTDGKTCEVCSIELR